MENSILFLNDFQDNIDYFYNELLDNQEKKKFFLKMINNCPEEKNKLLLQINNRNN